MGLIFQEISSRPYLDIGNCSKCCETEVFPVRNYTKRQTWNKGSSKEMFIKHFISKLVLAVDTTKAHTGLLEDAFTMGIDNRKGKAKANWLRFLLKVLLQYQMGNDSLQCGTWQFGSNNIHSQFGQTLPQPAIDQLQRSEFLLHSGYLL